MLAAFQFMQGISVGLLAAVRLVAHIYEVVLWCETS
jgi:hypothetical protein